MGKFFYLLFVLVMISSCNDGDVIEVELDFENSFQTCGELVFYKTKTGPDESLSIFINNLIIDEIIEAPYINNDSVFVALSDSIRTINIDGNTNKFNYRTYSSMPSNPFCSDIPSSELNITNDSAGTGIATITVNLTEDDNDGIPSEFEDINGNGDLTDDDTDGDGVPNYLDDDDDGDNVKTINESVSFEEEDNLLNALDTDNDAIPNYLDNDDDGDGVPTRDEESLLPDLNPANDITDPTEDPETGQTTPDYLNSEITASASNPITAYREHTVRQVFTVRIVITNLSIPQLSQDVLNFGILNDPITTDTRNPKTIFN